MNLHFVEPVQRSSQKFVAREVVKHDVAPETILFDKQYKRRRLSERVTIVALEADDMERSFKRLLRDIVTSKKLAAVKFQSPYALSIDQANQLFEAVASAKNVKTLYIEGPCMFVFVFFYPIF